MADVAPPSEDLHVILDRLDQLEARIHLLEAGRAPPAADSVEIPGAVASATAVETPVASRPAPKDDFEYEVGQNWFARVGILVLAAGGALLLAQPFPQLPPSVPSAAGAALALMLFGIARLGQRSVELLARYLRGAAMALLAFAALRMFFCGARPALPIDSAVGRALLVAVSGFNLAVAWKQRSPWLIGLALALGATVMLAIGTAAFVLGAMVVMAGVATAVHVLRRWTALVFVALVLAVSIYALWALGNPLRTGGWQITTVPVAAPVVLLLTAVVLAFATWLRPEKDGNEILPGAVALANSAVIYTLFLLHTARVFFALFSVLNLVASAVFVTLAVLFWAQWRSRASTFFYAMAGYVALSFAIIKAADVPNVFVWLSLQSLGVVATAIWFRSRFIVVANFLIFVAVALAYAALKERETGISLGIGIVALLSARLLNWQQARLELRTELMRNAYLLCAFVGFPYALYHLLPGWSVAVAWVGLALTYYGLNIFVRSPKYRWMGHGTLLLTTLYLVMVGTRSVDPLYRVVSFLVVGTALLAVSITFSWLRHRHPAGPATEPDAAVAGESVRGTPAK